MEVEDGAEAAWAPDLGSHRLLSDGQGAALLRTDGCLDWWCSPFDAPPLLWQLLDPAGAAACFPGATPLDADPTPAGATAMTRLRAPDGVVLQVRDGLLALEHGSALVRLVRHEGGTGQAAVEHALTLGGFAAPAVRLHVDGRSAAGTHEGVPLRVHADGHRREGDRLLSTLCLRDDGWSALVVVLGTADLAADPQHLLALLDGRAREERESARRARTPRRHPARALDALAVLRSCTARATGAVVAAPTTSLPEAPGHDRQFDYRYCWLRDASLSTAVAALLGQGQDARRYLRFVHAAWGDVALLERPVLTVRGDPVPDEREVPGIAGWAGSRPVRTGNDAGGQRQYDAIGLLVEAVSVHVQCGGHLDDRTWALVRRLADDVAAGVREVPDSNGIWELRDPGRLLDADLGRWLVLDRALWVARGWRPTTRRRHWRRARAVLADRVRAALREDGSLPQRYGEQQRRPDASALLAVAFGLLPRRDPQARRLVDAVLRDLGAWPWVHRYPPDASDDFSGREGAFLPVSFLAVTALAALGRVGHARARLDTMCAALPRLLAEEVDPATGRLLGNAPLVWSHAELARALYVLDAAELRQRWSVAGLWAWRLGRYVALRRTARRSSREPA